MNNENQTIHKSDDNLTIYGWNEKLNQLKQESIYSALAHGDVYKRQGGYYSLLQWLLFLHRE